MARPRYKPITPDQRIRELRQEFKDIRKGKDEQGPERAERLATFVREAHLERQLNMSMHAGRLCLEEDPEPPALLIEAYLPADLDDPEARLEALVDLKDLARYLDHEELRSYADSELRSEARTWVKDTDDATRRYRLRRVSSVLGREFADQLGDELRFL